MSAQQESESQQGEAEPLARTRAKLATTGAAVTDTRPAQTKRHSSVYFDPRWHRDLAAVFGWKFIAFIGFGMHVIKGLLAGGGSSGMLVIQRSIYVSKGVQARRKQAFTSVTSTPWAIKPVFGLINDTLPIAGYEKTIYLLGMSMLGTLSWSVVGYYGEAMPGEAICLAFLIAVTQVAWTDLMIEGLYAVQIKHHPRAGSDLVSFIWSGINFCGATGFLLAGPAIDLLGTYRVSFLAVPCAAAVAIPTVLGWAGEVRLSAGQRGCHGPNIAKLRAQPGAWPLVTAAVVLGLGCIVTATSAVAGTAPVPHFVLVCFCLGIVLATTYLKLDRGMAIVCIYMAAAQAVTIDTSGVSVGVHIFRDFFFLGDPSVCLPINGFGCPGFSASFYFTVNGLIDSAFAMLGAHFFNTTMRHWTYSKALNVSMVLLTLAHVLDIVMYQRLNRVLGIPDWLFMLGKTSTTSTVYMMNFLPTTLLISKICPDGLETTTYAMLAGISNFGQSVGGYAGAFLLEPFELGSIDGRCDAGCCVGPQCDCTTGCDDFSAFWRLSLTGTLLACCTIALNAALVPRIPMSAAIAVDPVTKALVAVQPQRDTTSMSLNSGGHDSEKVGLFDEAEC